MKKVPAKKGKEESKSGDKGPNLVNNGDIRFRIFPISGTHSIDFKFMIMYETTNPSNNKRIYRSKHNSRVKPIC